MILAKAKKWIKAYKNLLVFVASFLLLATYILNLNTELLFPSLKLDRKVLSSLVFMPFQGSTKYHIIKVKNNNKIIVEIYQILNEYNFKYLSQIDTGSKYEGYFLLGGNATNLAYINIDDDLNNEIIVPGFDNNLSAHLNVIKFDSSMESFSLVNQKVSIENN